MHRIANHLLHIVLPAALFGLTGCFTLVGLGVGSGLDAQAPDTLVVAARDLSSIGSNVPARILPTDGPVRAVVIVHPELEPEASYRARVSAACDPASLQIPIPPDTIRAIIGQTLYRTSLLSGYEADGIWFAPTPERTPFLLTWDRVTMLRGSDGRVWTGDQLRGACASANVPTRLGLLTRPAASSLATLLEDDPDETQFVPASTVRSVIVPHRTNNVWWGLVAGAALDVALSALLLREVGPIGFELHYR